MRTQDSQGRPDVAVVTAARAGDRRASEQLVRDCLPLVYNIVGRALDGHSDVDDVVQETMLRVLDGLPGLERPDRFRSWLVAITVRQIRDRWRRAGLAAEPLEEIVQEADPRADFADMTILRLALSGQRREAVEATRWLEDEEREVLALWWMETAGELTRGELSAACGLTPQHAAVRVQRVKERLETARAVVRALTSSPRCTQLTAALASWNGRPSALWRKRLARHVRDCPRCVSDAVDLVPAEGLLGGLALVPVPIGLAGLVLAKVMGPAAAGAGAAGTGAAGPGVGSGAHQAGGAGAHAAGGAGVPYTGGAGAQQAVGAGRTAQVFGKLAAKPVAAAAVGAVTLTAAGVAWYTVARSEEPASRPALTAPLSPAASSLSPSPSRSASAQPTATPTSTTASPTSASPSAAEARLSGRHVLRSVDEPGTYVSRSGGLGVLGQVGAASSAGTQEAATFTFVPGLADPDCYSLRDGAGRYVRHYAFRIRLDANDGSAIFQKDATFCARSGSTAGSVSLESYNYPGRYLRHRADLQLWLDPSENTAAYRASRSFVVAAPWS